MPSGWLGFSRQIWAANDEGAAATGSITGTGGSLVFVLASSVRVPLAQLPISNGLFPASPAW